MWFIGVEVEQETSAPPPKKNVSCFIRLNARTLYHFVQLTKKDRML